MKNIISANSIICIVTFVTVILFVNESKASETNFLLDSSIGRGLSRMYTECENSDDILRCLKIQAAKIIGRALKVHSIKVFDGVAIIKKPDFEDEIHQRSSGEGIQINNNDLDKLSGKSLDSIFNDRLNKFLSSHQIQINLPRLVNFGRKQIISVFEGRGKKDKGQKYFGPFIAAVLLKAAMMKMAFHSIALVAGKALIVGKIALIISAIIGLKKLVSSEGHEKTTYEIVKHPHIQQSHTYSSSHGEYEGHEGGGGGGSSYHRSIGDDEMIMSEKAYRAHVPRH